MVVGVPILKHFRVFKQRGAVSEWLNMLSHRAADCWFKLGSDLLAQLSVKSAVNQSLFNSRKAKAEKGVGWALLSISCVQYTVDLWP